MSRKNLLEIYQIQENHKQMKSPIHDDLIWYVASVLIEINYELKEREIHRASLVTG